MHRFTALLLAIVIGLSLLSGFYFSGLVAGLPFTITLAGASLPTILAGVWIFRISRQDMIPGPGKRVEAGAALFLLIGAVACAFRARHFGDWDAALIWNLHARYLTNEH